MKTNLVDRVLADPNYRLLKARRSRLGWWLTAALMLVYYGFILLIAFEKQVLATRIGAGVITWGIPVGFGVIVFTVVITAFYVMRANREFDDLTEKVRRGVIQ
ncbi:DUF485 domain-containing protein [Cereibacter sphaeroides]|uniref:DUF485 domain-containing protein n=1 Tax=Cereibacter sphaeroides TaxID=1063 RepID=UPI000E5AADCE|nr:DUF485 domain-containing protein [Cereibacter sphaeroides]RHZ99086.1 DUF485 domain-containing protein [Cereibacter sphaeroides]